MLSTLSCREGTGVALLQALLLLVPGSLEVFQMSKGEVLADRVSSCFLHPFEICFWTLKTGTRLGLAEFYSVLLCQSYPAQSMSTRLARRCSSRSR